MNKNKPLKILFIVSSFPSKDNMNNGAHNFRSIQNIKKKVDNVQVLHLRSWNFKRNFWEVYTIKGTNVWCFSFPFLPFLPAFLKGINIYFYKFTLHSILSIKRLINFNIIHSSGLTFAGVIGAYLSKKNKLKHIAQCMGSDVNIELPQVFNQIGYRSFEKNIDFFICNSQSLNKSLKLLMPNTNPITLYRGVNLKEFLFNPLISFQDKPKNSRITFLYLGGLVEATKGDFNMKGGVTLLNAWIDVLKTNTGIKESFRLVFAGPQVTEEKVKQIIGKPPSNYNIKVLGQINKNQVKELIIQASVIIVPSMAEGLPNVAMESMAIGRPVIGANIGGIPEIVIHNKTGLLHSAANCNELSNNIKAYITNPNLIINHANEAHIHVEKFFNSKNYTEKMLDIYLDLIS